MSCDTANPKAEKRCYDDQAENQDESPPKILTTPQRSRGKKDVQSEGMTTPRTRSRTPLVGGKKDVQSEGMTTPRTRSRTPLVERNDATQGTVTPTQRTRSKSPLSQKRSATMANLTPNSKSKSKTRLCEGDVKSTPTRERYATPTPTPRSRGRSAVSARGEPKSNTPNTRSRSQTPMSQKKECNITPRRAKSSSRDDSKTRSKIPVPAFRASKLTESAEKINKSTSKETSLHVEEPEVKNPQTKEKEKEEQKQVEDTSVSSDVKAIQDTVDGNELSKEINSSASDSTEEVTQVSSDTSGCTENIVPEVRKELQNEMEKVKRRRSTVGRSRKSIQGAGGRQSLCASIPVLGLQDQVNGIPKDLPQTSKVSHLLDISIREALRRLEQRLAGDECVSDLRLDLLTQSEDIAGQVSFATAGQPLVAEDVSSDSSASEGKENINEKIVAYRKKTKELEEEYKTWKTLLKQRKHLYQAAEREYREAKSGETKIEEEQIKQMSNVHRNLLASRPNYHQYIQELQTVRERALLMLQGVKHTTEVVSSFITSSRAEAESCYAAIEELSFGFLKNKPVKNVLKSIIQPSEIAIDN